MIIWGINALNHDSSLAVFCDDVLVKHTRSPDSLELTQDLVNSALAIGRPDKIYWYENPYKKKLRQLRSGQFSDAFDLAEFPEIYLSQFGINGIPIHYGEHHRSHAAAGYYCSNFDQAVVFVADAIGEFDTFTIWDARGLELRRIYDIKYPYSLGLFYSAFTKLLGFVPVRDENLVTKLSAVGDPNRYCKTVKSYLGKNLHRGIHDWTESIVSEDLAAAVQMVFLEEIQHRINLAKSMITHDNAVFMGGCAYNRAARDLMRTSYKNTYTMKFPGDSGSSIGCVLAETRQRLIISDIDAA